MVRATSGQGGKGSDRRPCSISFEVYFLRYDLAFGKITSDEYGKKMKAIKDKEHEPKL